ncbi:mRNA-capping enzyme subunit alpha [Lachancea thermotolerans]
MDNRAAPEIPGIRQPANVTQDIRLLVCKLLNSPKPAKTFPGSQPISFHHSDIEEKLLQQDYYVCEKTDGLRGLMLIVINPVTKEQGCFIIDRENNYYQVNGFRFPRLPKQSRKELLETFQDGTLIDGELVLQTNPVTKVKELRYLMFDCLAINGRCIVQSPTSSRLAHLGKEFFKPYYDLRSLYPAQCATFPFKISMKHMSFSVDLVKVANSLDKLPHVSDGLIFTPVTTPYVVGGKDSLLLKWKPETENTVDFKMILDIPKAEDTSLSKNDPNRFFYNYGVKPSFHLYIWQGGADVNARLHDFEQPFSKKELDVLDRTYKKFADLDVSDSQWTELKSLGEPLNGRIVECAKDQETGVWRMLRFRDDKLNGNYVSVVQKVLESISDSVKIEDLEEATAQMKSNWEKRQIEKKRGFQEVQDARRVSQPAPPTQPAPQNTEQPKYIDDDDEELWSDDDDDESDTEAKRQKL